MVKLWRSLFSKAVVSPPPPPKHLYVALYPVGEGPARRYHWAFLIGPEQEIGTQVPGTLYHVKNHPLLGWIYEELEIDNVRNRGTLLVRILIAKVTDQRSVARVFRRLPIVQGRRDWKCFQWFGSALEALKGSSALAMAELDWDKVSKFAKWFAGHKTDAGYYMDSILALQTRPTWNIFDDKEMYL